MSHHNKLGFSLASFPSSRPLVSPSSRFHVIQPCKVQHVKGNSKGCITGTTGTQGRSLWYPRACHVEGFTCSLPFGALRDDQEAHPSWYSNQTPPVWDAKAASLDHEKGRRGERSAAKRIEVLTGRNDNLRGCPRYRTKVQSALLPRIKRSNRGPP